MDRISQTIPASEIQADFDRIAPLSSGEGWNHSSHHYPFLLKHLPDHCGDVLDIGCGTGSFSRLLAARADRVLAIDLSAQMIRVAEERSQEFSNITYVQADVTQRPFPERCFDCIAAIATMHHLPLEDMSDIFRTALKPDGVLLILDLYQPQGCSDRLVDIMNVPLGAALKIVKTGRLREPEAVREAWAAHGTRDFFPTLKRVRDICEQHLPGARVKRHMLWRYSITWTKTHETVRKVGVEP